ncbi:MAG TPA: hypothetical protein VF272_03095 [Candidatus Saccharimonadia bacterium]
MQPLALSAEGQRLIHGLTAANTAEHKPDYDKVHISGVGGQLYFAYEQLRNAAEYGERHLLVRRAIERFLYRNWQLHDRQPTNEMPLELVSELTHARYLKNDSIPRSSVRTIEEIIQRYTKLAEAIRQHHKVPGDRLKVWVFQSASVEIEHQLVSHTQTDAFIDFVYHHYKQHIDPKIFDQVNEHTTEVVLYCAVHRTLFKSDIATTRYYALAARLHHDGADTLAYFVTLNQAVDRLYQAPLTNRVGRLANRSGGPMRILREVVMSTNAPEQLLSKHDELMSRVAHEAGQQYKLTRKRLNEGIVRSVIFLFITKVLLGVAIEVPYDLLVVGAVAWTPLIMNTLFPPLYMATIGWGIRTPGRRNTEIIQSQLSRILFQTDDPPIWYRVRKRVTSSGLNTAFNFVYAVAFLLSFGVLIYLLSSLGFNIVNGAIFFIFLSIVSFFGFRLLESARELEVVDQRKSLFSVALDFFYTPFIRVGHWLTDKYSRLNVVTFVMDLAIELPLKTSLRVVRQWAGFIRDKQEEL